MIDNVAIYDRGSKVMFGEFGATIMSVWQNFGGFDLISYRLVMTMADLVLILLSNNILMVLIMYYMTIRWAKERKIFDEERQQLEVAVTGVIKQGKFAQQAAEHLVAISNLEQFRFNRGHILRL